MKEYKDYVNSGIYNKEQLNELKLALNDGLDTTLFDNSNYSALLMREMRNYPIELKIELGQDIFTFLEWMNDDVYYTDANFELNYKDDFNNGKIFINFINERDKVNFSLDSNEDIKAILFKLVEIKEECFLSMNEEKLNLVNSALDYYHYTYLENYVTIIGIELFDDRLEYVAHSNYLTFYLLKLAKDYCDHVKGIIDKDEIAYIKFNGHKAELTPVNIINLIIDEHDNRIINSFTSEEDIKKEFNKLYIDVHSPIFCTNSFSIDVEKEIEEYKPKKSKDRDDYQL